MCGGLDERGEKMGLEVGEMKRWLALFGVVALTVGAIAGCGDDDDDGDGGDAATTEEAAVTEITVTADEYSFELNDTPTTDTESVTFDNQGKEGHAFVLAQLGEGFTLDEAIKLEGEKGSAVTFAEGGAGPGETQKIKVTEPIAPGEYLMLCPIQSPEGAHYELGQLEEVTVE